MVNSSTARSRSAMISTGRRRIRSTHAPAKSPTSRTARLCATMTSAISSGPASNNRIATSGTAVRVTTEPSEDTVCPVHSFMKSECRQSDSVVTGGKAYACETAAMNSMRQPEGGRLWTDVRDMVSRAVVVDDEPLRLLIVAMLTHGHALVEDVPGVGKTLLTRAFSRSLGLGFARVQGTPDLLPSDVLGASLLEGNAFRFVPGPVFTNVLLVDEINRATPRTQSALLEAMEEGQVSIEGETRPLPDPFLVLATQNPIELEGTFALPEAQLDRFLVRLALGYP